MRSRRCARKQPPGRCTRCERLLLKSENGSRDGGRASRYLPERHRRSRPAGRGEPRNSRNLAHCGAIGLFVVVTARSEHLLCLCDVSTPRLSAGPSRGPAFALPEVSHPGSQETRISPISASRQVVDLLVLVTDGAEDLQSRQAGAGQRQVGLVARPASRSYEGRRRRHRTAGASPGFANRKAQRSASCGQLSSKHKTESGHLRSAADIAASPLGQARRVVPASARWR